MHKSVHTTVSCFDGCCIGQLSESAWYGGEKTKTSRCGRPDGSGPRHPPLRRAGPPRPGAARAARPFLVGLPSGGAEVQVGVQICKVHQPPDDWVCAGDDELMSAPGQAFMCPDQDRQTGAIGEVQPGQVHHQGCRVVLQDIVDGLAQMVPVGHVKLALQPQH